MSGREPKSRFRWIGNVLFVGILAVVVGWLALTRWNSVPANSAAPVLVDGLPAPAIDAQIDRTAELVAALAAIPPVPPLVLPTPPEGMAWNPTSAPLDLSDAALGEWLPGSRPALQGVIAFLDTVEVDDVLSRLATIKVGAFRAENVNLSAIRQAAKLLVARARLRWAAQGDFDGAWADLKTLIRLSSSGYQSGESLVFLTSIACEYLADWELIRLCHDRPITREQMMRIKADLSQTTLDQRETWRAFVAGRVGSRERILDLAYTNDGQGNGWLVLSRLNDAHGLMWATPERSGAWNLLSPLFNSRQTVAKKLKAYRNACELIERLPYAKAQTAAESADSNASFFSILDGPLAMLGTDRFVEYGYGTVVRRTAMQRACITAAALSAYRREHGLYPATLDALVGDYLQTVPLDPYSDEPFRYQQLQEGLDFLLYAVGPNQVDDGGLKKALYREDPPELRKEDVVFDHIRPKPNFEPKLEPTKK